MTQHAPQIGSTEDEMFNFWQSKTHAKFPEQAILSENIIHDLLERYDPETRRYKAHPSGNEKIDNILIGEAHYLIAEMLHNYDRLGLDLNDDFHRACYAYLHLDIPDVLSE